MSWARRSGVVYSGPNVLDMPVMSPYRHKPPALRTRKTPGDPRCAACRKTKRGYCAEHRDYHHVTVGIWGIG